MVCDTSAIKRSDLTLRCRYIGLETEIYQIDKTAMLYIAKTTKATLQNSALSLMTQLDRWGLG